MVSQVRAVPLGQLELLATVVRMEHLDPADPLATWESPALQVGLASVDVPAIPALAVRKERLEPAASPVNRETKARLDNRVRMGNRAPQDLQDHKALWAASVSRAGWDLLVSRVTRASLETPDLPALREISDSRANKVLSGLSGNLALLDNLEQLEPRARRETPDVLDRLARLGFRAHREVLVHLASLDSKVLVVTPVVKDSLEIEDSRDLSDREDSLVSIAVMLFVLPVCLYVIGK